MRLAYSHEWPVHLKVAAPAAEPADREGGGGGGGGGGSSSSSRPQDSLHEIYDIAIALDTAGCVVDSSRRLIRLTRAGGLAETDLPSPSFYVSAGFPCRALLVFDSAGRHLADVSLSLHSAVHIAGVAATSESVLSRYHIGRVHIHARSLYVADCEFDFVYVCDLAGDVRHVISWPEKLCAPMGMCVSPQRLFVCDSGHRRVRVYNLTDYRPVLGEDAPGRFPDVHTRGVCRCGGRGRGSLVAGDFESDRLLVVEDGGDSRASAAAARSVSVPGMGEPFALVPGPLADTVFVSSSGVQGDHTVKLVSLAAAAGMESPTTVLASCGGGGPGGAAGQFNKPRGLAFDRASNRLFVVDAKNYRIQAFRLEETPEAGTAA